MLQKYLITSREFYSDTPAVFREKLHSQFIKHLPNYALYRDKVNPHYEGIAEHFVEVCNQFENIKSFLHSDIDLAKKLHAYGVHLTSLEFEKIVLAKELGLKVIISTHSLKEVLKAEDLGADYVTYSPIFATPNKGEPKGIEDLKSIIASSTIKVFALGGIVDAEEIQMIEETSAYGFASIRYFY